MKADKIAITPSIFSRRTFLKRSAGTAAFVLAGGASRQLAAAPKTDRVVIIGAGIAGLSAARRLIDRTGLTAPEQLIVLEGGDRTGGRIRTSRALTSPVDLGAAWIHGERRNPLTRIADDAGIVRSPTDYESLELFGAGGLAIARTDYERVFDDVFEPAMRAATRYANSRDSDISLADALAASGAGSGLSAADRAILDWDYFWDIELDRTFSLNALSTWQHEEDRAYRGADVLFPGGYDQIPDHLAAGVDVRLNHAVSEIDYTGDTIRIVTNQGEFLAERCLVTVPLGVLKNGDITFTPALPDAKSSAIERLGFGNAHKIALEFPTAFWNDSTHFFGSIGAPRSESLEFLNAGRVNATNILLAEANDVFAASLEAMSDANAVARVMLDLRDMFGAGIPEPNAYVRSEWGTSPLTRGSYSYWTVGSTGRDQKEIARPIDRKLFFAGEHTSRKYPGTVHGAFRSGDKVARKLGSAAR